MSNIMNFHNKLCASIKNKIPIFKPTLFLKVLTLSPDIFDCVINLKTLYQNTTSIIVAIKQQVCNDKNHREYLKMADKWPTYKLYLVLYLILINKIILTVFVHHPPLWFSLVDLVHC